MKIQHSTQHGCVIVTLTGRIDLASVAQVQRALLKHLSVQPVALICDLAGVRYLDPVFATVFSTVAHHPVSRWPTTSFLLCCAQPQVARTLSRVRVSHLVPLYGSVEEAMDAARARPAYLREELRLTPIPAAARAARAFVREVCQAWQLARPDETWVDRAVLVANELVTNAVVHARTDLSLRLELRAGRLFISVGDGGPRLLRPVTPQLEAEGGRGLWLVEQLTRAWGVRPHPDGGKIVWCALELPLREAAMVRGGRQVPASTHTAAMAVGPDRSDRGPAEAASAAGSDLVWAKLAPPALGAGLIPRPRLQSLLQAGVQAKLCVVAAPAGSGKTTLLGQWHAAWGGGRVAWMSVDEGDNDPIRFWTAVIEALRTVEPTLGTAALAALGGPGVDLGRVVLASLLGEFDAVDRQLVLVLDNYQLVSDATCLRSLGLFLEHLPAGVHVVLATRVDPPLPLAGLRAWGELAELRAADLQFTGEEAAELLNGAMGLQLTTEDVARLVERAEGQPAGLVLAGLALRGRPNPGAFIDLFHRDDRHVSGLLGTEVLAYQPEQVRRFLLRTSILDRLSGPLCDAVLETKESAELLGELEYSNPFLEPLDDQRQWYRYQQLFAELLRLELTYRKPALVPVLHRRAAAWHRQAGNLQEADYHATAAGTSPKPTR